MQTKVIVNLALLQELADGMQQAAFRPTFGDVFLGVLDGQEASFGHGIPHYGMVRGGLAGRPEQPLVPFAPITSKRTNTFGALFIPKGLLPPKEGEGPVDSFVLLFWRTIKIPGDTVRDTLQKRATLPEPYLGQARKLIKDLRKRQKNRARWKTHR